MTLFTCHKNLYVETTTDNRISLYDTKSGKLKLTAQEPNHLKKRYTSLGIEIQKKNKKTKVKKNESSENNGVVFIAAGDSEGNIAIWDFSSGELLKEGLDIGSLTGKCSIDGLCFSSNCESLFASSLESSFVVEINVKSGKIARKFKVGKQGAKSICVSPCGDMLLTAGLSMKLWSLKSGDKIKRFSGHSTPVCMLAFSNDSKYIISGCEDRFLSLWSCEIDDSNEKKVSKKKNRKSLDTTDGQIPLQRSPDQVFGTQSPPSSIYVGNLEGNRFLLGVCLKDKSASLWSVDIQNSFGEKSRKPDCLLVSTDISALVINTESKKDLNHILVIRSSPLQPIFESVDIFSDESLKSKVQLSSIKGQNRLFSNGKTQNNTDSDGDNSDNDSTIADMKEESKEGKEKLHIVKGKESLAATPKSLSISVEKNGHSADDDNNDDDDKTMAEKLKELSSQLDTRIQQEGKIAQGEILASKKRPRDKNFSQAVISLSTVLEQALQSNDNQLLEVCLRNSDHGIVTSTVERLSSVRALQFLNSIVKKFEQRPARAPQLIVWIKALLDKHASHLLTVPDLAESLSGLYQIVENRLSIFPKFLKLQGRLEFVLSQVSRQAQEQENASPNGPKVVYDEEEDMEVDSEDDDEAEDDDSKGDGSDEDSSEEEDTKGEVSDGDSSKEEDNNNSDNNDEVIVTSDNEDIEESPRKAKKVKVNQINEKDSPKKKIQEESEEEQSDSSEDAAEQEEEIIKKRGRGRPRKSNVAAPTPSRRSTRTKK